MHSTLHTRPPEHSPDTHTRQIRTVPSFMVFFSSTPALAVPPGMAAALFFYRRSLGYRTRLLALFFSFNFIPWLSLVSSSTCAVSWMGIEITAYCISCPVCQSRPQKTTLSTQSEPSLCSKNNGISFRQRGMYRHLRVFSAVYPPTDLPRYLLLLRLRRYLLLIPWAAVQIVQERILL
jgi:hypothetical protein